MKTTVYFGKLKLTWAILLAALLVSGCGTQQRVGQFQVVQGERFDYQKVNEIVDGSTSDNVIYDYFGQPLSRESQGDTEKLLYRFTEVKRDETSGFLKSDSEEMKVERTLEITLQDGIVKTHDYTERKTKTTESNRF